MYALCAVGQRKKPAPAGRRRTARCCARSIAPPAHPPTQCTRKRQGALEKAPLAAEYVSNQRALQPHPFPSLPPLSPRRQGAPEKAPLAAEYVSNQKALDAALLPALSAELKGYLSSRFTLRDGDRPHMMKF